MDIKESKFFVAADLKILRALGFSDLEVNVDTEGESEEIALGDNQYLVGERGDLGTSYYVIDRDCHEAFTHGETSIMALAHYQSSSLTHYNYDEIPDYFWMWELREIFYRKNQKKGVSAKRFQRYRDEPGMAVVFSADCKKVKLAKNKFSKYDKDGRYCPLPDELPAFDEWEAIKDSEGKPIVANCAKVFESRSFAEQSRALNILLKKFYKPPTVYPVFPDRGDPVTHRMGNNQQGDNNMKKHTYIQEYSIRGGMDEHADEETKCSSIMVKGDNPEQELWDIVLDEIRGGYEQRLFVNDFDYDIVGGDESIAELREEGMEAFKKDHNIDKITSMGYYNDAWSGWMSDQTVYRIEERIEKPTVEQIKATVLRYLDEKFENARVIDDYRDTVVEGLQASYTNKEELRADIERIFEEGAEFYEPEE